MITMTEKAALKVKEIAEAEGVPSSVRAKIYGAGCSGYMHDLVFEAVAQELDEIVEFDGVKIIIDPLSNQYLDNATIDYFEQGFSSGFKFLSPDQKGSCACGNSVSY